MASAVSKAVRSSAALPTAGRGSPLRTATAVWTAQISFAESARTWPSRASPSIRPRLRIMTSAGSPASRRARMAPTAANMPSIVAPLVASNVGRSASTKPWAAPPLKTLTVFVSVIARSLHFDAGLLDQLGPLVGVAPQEGIELTRRQGHGNGALLGPGFADRRLGDDPGDLGIQPVDDLLGRALGRHDAEPDRRLIARHAGLAHGRHVGQHGRALLARRRQCTDLAGIDTTLHRGDGVEHHLDVAAHHVVARVAAVLVRHVQDVGAAHGFEQLAVHVLGRAGARQSARELSAPSLAERT